MSLPPRRAKPGAGLFDLVGVFSRAAAACCRLRAPPPPKPLPTRRPPASSAGISGENWSGSLRGDSRYSTVGAGGEAHDAVASAGVARAARGERGDSRYSTPPSPAWRADTPGERCLGERCVALDGATRATTALLRF